MSPLANLVYAIAATLAACVGILALAIAARRADARREAARWPTPSQLQDAGYTFRGR